jgi:hypothetical protein
VNASKHETGGCQLPATAQLALTRLNVHDARCVLAAQGWDIRLIREQLAAVSAA